jgi:hypothetical protein
MSAMKENGTLKTKHAGIHLHLTTQWLLCNQFNVTGNSQSGREPSPTSGSVFHPILALGRTRG